MKLFSVEYKEEKKLLVGIQQDLQVQIKISQTFKFLIHYFISIMIVIACHESLSILNRYANTTFSCVVAAAVLSFSFFFAAVYIFVVIHVKTLSTSVSCFI